MKFDNIKKLVKFNWLVLLKDKKTFLTNIALNFLGIPLFILTIILLTNITNSINSNRTLFIGTNDINQKAAYIELLNEYDYTISETIDYEASIKNKEIDIYIDVKESNELNFYYIESNSKALYYINDISKNAKIENDQYRSNLLNNTYRIDLEVSSFYSQYGIDVPSVYLIAILIFISNAIVVTGIFTGVISIWNEKEEGKLNIILNTKISSEEFIIAKIIYHASISIIMGLASSISIFLLIFFANLSLEIGLIKFLLILFISLLYILTFSIIYVLVGVSCKKEKNVLLFISLFFIINVLVFIFCYMFDMVERVYSLLPLFNIIYSIKLILYGMDFKLYLISGIIMLLIIISASYLFICHLLKTDKMFNFESNI
jgi:ABC-type Na+ efflux pump permease subunit